MKFLCHTVVVIGLAALAGVASADPDTHVSQPPFQITFPGSWSKTPSHDPTLLVYRLGNDQQMTVSLLPARHPFGKEEQASILKKIVDVHRDSEIKATANPPEFSPVVYSENMRATFTSRDLQGKRAAGTLVIVTAKGVVVFYLEVLDASPDEFAKKWKPIVENAAVN